MGTAFITHPDCALHEMGSGHPECPERLGAIRDQLIASGVLAQLTEYEAPLASAAALARVHVPRYIQALEQCAPREGHVHLDPDTAMNSHSLRAAMRAAGAVELAAGLVLGAKEQRAFCAVRPPGHHAERARAMGFCFFNNVAVGAAHALEHHGLARVAVVDFDVHHGNGTQNIFQDDERVLMVSTFQHPFYPYSGIEGRSERMVNIPLPARSDGRQFRAAVEKHWLPALDSFAPECLFISAGFDAHREDDMASLGLVEADYAWVTKLLVEVANRHAQGRIVSVLEGGYALSALGRSVVAHIKVLAGLQ
ncbi:MAG: histone deacetylase family protein [Betaproteobacteria bacterium]|nr:histone deacetylase family protein [Betaproteobacteria bacterium]